MFPDLIISCNTHQIATSRNRAGREITLKLRPDAATSRVSVVVLLLGALHVDGRRLRSKRGCHEAALLDAEEAEAEVRRVLVAQKQHRRRRVCRAVSRTECLTANHTKSRYYLQQPVILPPSLKNRRMN
jgi:hypothetical protein